MKAVRYFSVIGFILLFLIIRRIDLAKLSAVLSKLDYSFVILVIFTVVLEVALRVYRWKVLVNLFDKGYSMKGSFVTYMIGIGLGGVTPAKSGDLIKSVDLQSRTKLELKDALSISIFDKVVDLLMLFAFGGAAAILTVLIFNQLGYLIPSTIIIILLIAGFMFLVVSKSMLGFVRSVYYLLVPARFKMRIRSLYYSLRRVSRLILGSSRFYVYISATILALLIIFIRPWLFASGLGIDVKLWQVLLFSPLVQAIENLPISIMGIGSRDIALITLFGLVGIAAEEMFAISLLLFVVVGLPQIIMGLIIALITKKA